MIGQFKGRQKTNVYGWVSDLAVARSGFNQIAYTSVNKALISMFSLILTSIDILVYWLRNASYLLAHSMFFYI